MATENEGVSLEKSFVDQPKKKVEKIAKSPSQKEIKQFVESVLSDSRLNTYAAQSGGYKLLRDARDLLNKFTN